MNFREGWRGYLFQGRFASYPMDEAHLMVAVRYVERSAIGSAAPASAGLERRRLGANPDCRANMERLSIDHPGMES